MKSFATLAALLLLALSATAQQQSRPVNHDTPFVHDPVMAFEDSTYYLFSTGHGISVATSNDRRQWHPRFHQPLMSVMPQWTRDSVPGFTTHVWAPDVIRWHNRWWMAYSCSTFGKNTSAIGLLTAPSLHSPIWEDRGAIVCSRGDRDDWNAIDPCFVIDAQDQPWLFFGSFWDGIQLVPLDTTMHVKTGCRPQTVARRHAPGDKSAAPNPTSKYAGTNAIEAPFVMTHNGWYYLFVSFDYCCRGSQSNYRVAVGRSRHVAGPYADRDGKPMLQGGGTILLQGDGREFEAAGHCAAYHFADADVFVCHGYSIAHQGQSVLVQKNIEWDVEDWPVLR